ncbi:MAG: OmpA family protein, partial [Bacteroidota bacterium]
YVLSLDTDDPNLSEYEKVFIADKNGKVVRELHRLKQFQYGLLAYEKVALAEMYVDDSWLAAGNKMGVDSSKNNLVVKNKETAKKDTVKKDVVVAKNTKKDTLNKEKLVKKIIAKDTLKKDVVVKKIISKDTVKKVVVVKKIVSKDTVKKVIANNKKDCSERLYVPVQRPATDTLLFMQKIPFTYASWYLNPESFVLLDEVVVKMKSDNQIKLVLNSHSDSRGDDKMNLKISEFRAKSIQNYLIKKGVDKNKIQINCFGEMQMVSPCCDGSSCSEEMHALNRRAELELVKSK